MTRIEYIEMLGLSHDVLLRELERQDLKLHEKAEILPRLSLIKAELIQALQTELIETKEALARAQKGA